MEPKKDSTSNQELVPQVVDTSLLSRGRDKIAEMAGITMAVITAGIPLVVDLVAASKGLISTEKLLPLIAMAELIYIPSVCVGVGLLTYYIVKLQHFR